MTKHQLLDRFSTALVVLAIGAAILLLAARCGTPPTPVPPTPPVPVVDAGSPDSGDLEDQACRAAESMCGTNYDECVLQVMRLRRSTYAELSDDDLKCWVSATTPAAMRACGNGSCQ